MVIRLLFIIDGGGEHASVLWLGSDNHRPREKSVVLCG
jgi:hypothetical protein